jgi:hypothetical protein
MATDKQVESLKTRIGNERDEFAAYKKTMRSRIEDATDPVGRGAMDMLGGTSALAAKAGIEVVADWARKVQTPVGQYRAPSPISGGISLGLGTAVWLGNLAMGLPFPNRWYRELPDSFGSGLIVLGTKEIGSWLIVWNEKRQIAATQAAAAQLLAAQQPTPALSNEAAKKG